MRNETPAGVDHTPHDQFDSIVLPQLTWLQEQGVEFRMGSQVMALDFAPHAEMKSVVRIHYRQDDTPKIQVVQPHDLVFMTNGSMTANSTLGSMTAASVLDTAKTDGAWALWETVARKVGVVYGDQ